tara:strand:+ start:386 stop:616 length:231 start_codon:yes stop_codon:yes gene_type:complete
MEKKKICDLKLNNTQKMILTLLVKPNNLFGIAARLDLSYYTVYINNRILLEKGLVKKTSSPSGKNLFKTNMELIEL